MIRTRWPVMRLLAPLLAMVLLAGCSPDDAKPGQEQRAEPTATPTADGAPAFTAEDYRFQLIRDCRCAFLVPVTVTVRRGEVVEAVAARDGGRGVVQGDPAPETHRMTIPELIELARDPAAVDIRWPSGQAWPDRFRLPGQRRALDTGVTYTIRRVSVD